MSISSTIANFLGMRLTQLDDAVAKMEGAKNVRECYPSGRVMEFGGKLYVAQSTKGGMQGRIASWWMNRESSDNIARRKEIDKQYPISAAESDSDASYLSRVTNRTMRVTTNELASLVGHRAVTGASSSSGTRSPSDTHRNRFTDFFSVKRKTLTTTGEEKAVVTFHEIFATGKDGKVENKLWTFSENLRRFNDRKSVDVAFNDPCAQTLFALIARDGGTEKLARESFMYFSKFVPMDGQNSREKAQVDVINERIRSAIGDDDRCEISKLSRSIATHPTDMATGLPKAFDAIAEAAQRGDAAGVKRAGEKAAAFLAEQGTTAVIFARILGDKEVFESLANEMGQDTAYAYRRIGSQCSKFLEQINNPDGLWARLAELADVAQTNPKLLIG